ncbi:MAG: 50S ribosomal protein L11 methyltransferase [Pseudomonadota bacterium]
METRTELLRIIEESGRENIWRPIRDESGVLLAPGTEDMRDGAIRDLARVDFRGRTVLDLGCNFGFFAFLAKRFGAAEAIGVDRDALAVRGCGLLNRLKGSVRGVRFLAADFMTEDIGGPYDICLMINFMGVNAAAGGLGPFLDRAAALAREAMVFTARPAYRLDKHFGSLADGVAALYPPEFIRRRRFFMIEYMAAHFAGSWKMETLSPDYQDIDVRRTIIFRRENGPMIGRGKPVE